MTKLSEGDVRVLRQIRTEHAGRLPAGLCKLLAREMGITVRHVRMVMIGRYW